MMISCVVFLATCILTGGIFLLVNNELKLVCGSNEHVKSMQNLWYGIS